jgi:hypothetical protein
VTSKVTISKTNKALVAGIAYIGGKQVSKAGNDVFSQYLRLPAAHEKIKNSRNLAKSIG